MAAVCSEQGKGPECSQFCKGQGEIFSLSAGVLGPGLVSPVREGGGSVGVDKDERAGAVQPG